MFKTKEEAISYFMLDDHYGDVWPGRKWYHCWVNVFDVRTGMCSRCNGQWMKCPCVPVSIGSEFSGVFGYSVIQKKG